ncbi:GNAT family N-acetyltransferase [Peribacillus sp. B-H-3]|jgi:hypothetical protein|uniref:GNAT family N-acetyltransferase n=1 Tax=Peribacillus sp. B-H-3 TaxID=3400420 RepID=UPI003B0167FE
MNWYEKLNQYFPIQEMKSREHMETLLNEKASIYKKDEGPNHVLMYVETEDFIFIDYLFVSGNSRGQGLGKKLIQMLQDKQKPILLEVEPASDEDQDSQKRLRFYKRAGFIHASSISYRRRSLATNKINGMEILYWSSSPVNESEIFEDMKVVYKEIHTHKDLQFYGKEYQPSEEVLKLQKSGDEEDILEAVN